MKELEVKKYEEPTIVIQIFDYDTMMIPPTDDDNVIDDPFGD